MSRLGSWSPETLEARVDRMESLTAIRQLAHRYAVAIDSRDMDMVVDLFVVDVRVGRDEAGRGALKSWFSQTMSRFRSTCHFVGNHVVDFEGPDRAKGIVYCHDELEVPGREQWLQGQLQYWATYRRDAGEWYFERRKFHRLYLSDWPERPSHGAGNGAGESALTSHQLPEAYPTWSRFWEKLDQQSP